MAELTFSQSERRSFLVPALIALALIGGGLALTAWFTPHRIAGLKVIHTAVLPTHTVFKSDSIVVGQDPAQDELYVLATLRIDDQLKLPLFIKDMTGTLVGSGGGSDTTSAVQKGDLAGLYVTFPALKPLASAPLLRETDIQPGQTAEGMVLLHFPVDQAAWDARQSATVTIDFYHQGPLSVTIPKP